MNNLACSYPDCHEHSCGVSIQGREVCKDHIDWAMKSAFAQFKEGLKDIISAAQNIVNQNNYKHACPDWDYLVIDKNDPEIMGCVCDFTKQVREVWYAFCDLFEPGERMKILTLHEITNALAAADRTGKDSIQLSETIVAQIAYGLGHADRVIKKLAKVNAEMGARIEALGRVMPPELE